MTVMYIINNLYGAGRHLSKLLTLQAWGLELHPKKSTWKNKTGVCWSLLNAEASDRWVLLACQPSWMGKPQASKRPHLKIKMDSIWRIRPRVDIGRPHTCTYMCSCTPTNTWNPTYTHIHKLCRYLWKCKHLQLFEHLLEMNCIRSLFPLILEWFLLP